MNYYREEHLWKWFSLFIRARDAGPQGVSKCFTCNFRGHWRSNMQCGHGHGRQHMGTKYSEKNNHSQCAQCNLDGGRQDVYSLEVDRLYGAGTWALLDLAAKRPLKVAAFEVHAMTLHYYQEAKRIAAEKGLDLPDELPALDKIKAPKKQKVKNRPYKRKERLPKGEQWSKWIINRKRDQNEN